MVKIRVHELAKEMGMSSKQMVNNLQKMGLDIKNHMSTLEESQAAWVRKRLETKTEKAPAKTPIKAAGKPSPPTDRPVSKQERPAGEVHHDSAAAKTKTVTPTDKREHTRFSQDTRVDSRDRDNQDRRPPTKRQATGEGSRQGSQPAGGRDNAGKSSPRPGGADKRPQPPRPGSTPRTGQAPAQGDNRPRPTTGADKRSADHRQKAGTRSVAGNAPAGQKQQQRPSGQAPSGGPQRRPNVPASSPGKKPEVKKGTDNRGAGQARDGVKKPGTANVQGKPGKKAFPTRDYSRPQRKGKHKKKKEEVILETPEKILAGESIQVRELAEKLAKSSAEIVKKLMELGVMATINQEIDFETVEILASLYDVKVEREISEEEQILEEIIDSEESLEFRSPIVTVMGHVDHGKTSLLDKIRKADVVSGEAGGITQHIGAYQVTVKNNRITFIDTPGHEAFTAMRARGANLTDIVILVVAADDGVMPQTIEAINHIKAAKVPFIVALNKMDKPEVNPDRVMQQLTEYQIVPEEWGGDTMFIPVSAKTGMGIDNILEMVLLLAEMNDLRANPNRPAEGVVIEGELDKGKGAVATLLVQKGTLKIGDCIVCGYTWCKVRAMTDYRGRRVEQAYPSMPVEITGWSDVPEVGEKVVVTEEKIAKEIAELRRGEKKLDDQKQTSKISLDDFFKQMQNSGVKELNLIIKGDVQGTIEALAQSLLRLSTDEVKVHVIHSAVGAINESDVMLASASNAIIIGFNVRPDVKARKYGEEENIDIRMYRVIYEAIEDVKKAMVGLLDPEYREKYLGRAEVRQTFKVPNIGTVAGSYIIDGKMQRNADIRVLRDSVIIHEGKLTSLKRFKDDVKEVLEGYECGMGVKDFYDLKEGDIIEGYTLEEIAREL